MSVTKALASFTTYSRRMDCVNGIHSTAHALRFQGGIGTICTNTPSRIFMGAQQLSLFGRAEEARMYHDISNSGFFAILVDRGGEKKQSSHRLIEMPTVLNLIDKTRDSWMSQAEFLKPDRRVVNLARIGL